MKPQNPTKRYRYSARRAPGATSDNQLHKPKKSFGVIIFDTEWRVLLVQRKDSFGYLACIDNSALGHETVADTLATITLEERDKLLAWDWERLWQDCGLGTTTKEHKDQCRARFEWLSIRDTVAAMDRRGEKWQSANAWGLPKGRMAWKDNETALRCALREMEEETGVRASSVAVLHETGTFKEEYKGTDGRIYSSTYYVARLIGEAEGEVDPKEIRQVCWMSVEECEKLLRPELLQVITDALRAINGPRSRE